MDGALWVELSENHHRPVRILNPRTRFGSQRRGTGAAMQAAPWCIPTARICTTATSRAWSLRGVTISSATYTPARIVVPDGIASGGCARRRVTFAFLPRLHAAGDSRLTGALRAAALRGSTRSLTPGRAALPLARFVTLHEVAELDCAPSRAPLFRRGAGARPARRRARVQSLSQGLGAARRPHRCGRNGTRERRARARRGNRRARRAICEWLGLVEVADADDAFRRSVRAVTSKPCPRAFENQKMTRSPLAAAAGPSPGATDRVLARRMRRRGR